MMVVVKHIVIIVMLVCQLTNHIARTEYYTTGACPRMSSLAQASYVLAPPMTCRLVLQQGDLTKWVGDAIVNAGNDYGEA